MSNFVQGCSGGINPGKTLHAHRGREDITQRPPERRDRIHRPGNTGDKHQDHRCKDKQDHRFLAVGNESGKRHREEDTRKQIRQDKENQIQRLPDLREGKQARHDDQYPGTNYHIQDNVSQTLP